MDCLQRSRFVFSRFEERNHNRNIRGTNHGRFPSLLLSLFSEKRSEQMFYRLKPGGSNKYRIVSESFIFPFFVSQKDRLAEEATKKTGFFFGADS